MKMKYGHWIDEIPEITQAGTYTLNPISSSTPTNVAYKIQSSDPNQYYVLEYRDNTSLFETGLPGSGLLVYRIDTRYEGNEPYDPSNGIYDEIYIFRPNGSSAQDGDLDNAYFSSNVGRTEFNSSTSAYPFFTGGSPDYNFSIYNITSAGSTISFSYGTSSDCSAPTNLVATVEDNNLTLSWDAVTNAVSYNIYRNGNLIENISGTTYSDNNLAYGRYTYFLRSVDANGLFSAASETISVALLPEGSVIIGDGEITDDMLPSYSYYKYALTQQIYTAEELGEAGYITSIAFYNDGNERIRNYDFYLKSTTKSTFTSTTDWVTVTEADKVFSGSVTMTTGEWTMITFDTPFDYDGISNVVLVADDNTGSWDNSMSCRVFDAPSQAIRVYSDHTNFNPGTPPTSFTSNDYADLLNVKNQLLVAKVIPTTDPININVSASPARAGIVSGGGSFMFGEICTVTATANSGFSFCGWTEDGQVISTELEYSFTVMQGRNLVATFEEGVLIGDGGTTTNSYLPSYNYFKYSLTQQIYTADEIGTACTINSISFYNGGAEKTRTCSFYLIATDKTSFASNSDWVAVTNADMVFSGSVQMVSNDWTKIVFDTSFVYDGISNLVLVVDDNSGAWTNSPHMACRVFNASRQAIRICSDGINYNPSNPSGYSGTVMNEKNQIKLGIETEVEQTVALSEGINWFSTNVEITLDDLKAALVAAVPGTSITIQSQTQNTLYNPNNHRWTGGLNTLNVAHMYKIIVSADCEISLEGMPINPTEHPVTIRTGANWIAFPFGESKTISETFAGFAVNGDAVQSQTSNTNYRNSRWVGQLSTLEPGKGYIYQSSVSGDRIFTFPSGTK
jgi:hypothetical protein